MPIHHPDDILPLPSLQPDTDPMLLVRDLYFTYPNGHRALQGVNLEVHPGERVALVGPNGAGKSTLLLHFNGLLSGEGEIQVAGLPVAPPHLPVIRAMVGLVFQNPDDQLFSPTVFEDVAFGPLHMGLEESVVRQRVEQALDQVGMRTYATRSPYHLSMGEKKRIAIATVLAMNPAILVLDEPSAGLDPRARRGLIQLLQRLPQVQIIATHDMLLARDLCPRMVLMDQGQIVADGPTTELFQQETLLQAHGLERPEC